ncbi:hypothetical protein BC830DRAFT_283237 [Chytriomyces sp. MP71]|nr:hypothetical protein BC830DRAFT_283237 [Chytriomyces sp. MP71]
MVLRMTRRHIPARHHSCAFVRGPTAQRMRQLCPACARSLLRCCGSCRDGGAGPEVSVLALPFVTIREHARRQCRLLLTSARYAFFTSSAVAVRGTPSTMYGQFWDICLLKVGSNMADRAGEVASAVSDALRNLVNESSVGLFRIQEHVFKKTAVIVADRKSTAQLNASVELALTDALEAKAICNQASRVHGLHASLDALRHILEKHGGERIKN